VAERILITGAGGYLGQRVAQTLVRRGHPVTLWIHADDEATAAVKRARLTPAFAGREHLVRWTWGALEAPEPFQGVEPGSLAGIVHAAAIYRFDIDADTARRVNVAGTRKALDLATRCPSLSRFTLVSSFYASGLRAGVIPEEPLAFPPDEPFTNEYERSKYMSEVEALARPEVPWQIARVGLVVADDASGHVTQHNAFHYCLKLFHAGHLAHLPGDPETRLCLVTGGFAAEALAALVTGADARQVYHLIHDTAHGVPLREAIELVWEVFQQDPAFVRRGLAKPGFTDLAGFERELAPLAGSRNPVTAHVLGSVATFARQLFARKEAGNGRLVAAWPSYAPEDQHALVGQTAAHLVRTRFGRNRSS
jgi:nucleoside-diphosphate-sugar epimerase